MRFMPNGEPPHATGEATPLANVFIGLVAVVMTGVDINGVCESSKSLEEGTLIGGPNPPNPLA